MVGFPFWPVGVLIVVYLLWRAPVSTLRHVPTVRYKWYLPDFVNRMLYYPKAASMISQGYHKVRRLLGSIPLSPIDMHLHLSTRIVPFGFSQAMEKSSSCH